MLGRLRARVWLRLWRVRAERDAYRATVVWYAEHLNGYHANRCLERWPA